MPITATTFILEKRESTVGAKNDRNFSIIKSIIFFSV